MSVVEDFYLRSPCVALFVGHNNSRKTSNFKKLVENLQHCCPGPPLSLLTLFYDVHQPVYDELQAAAGCPVRLVQGVPENISYQDYFPTLGADQRQIVCFDDCSHLLRRRCVAQLWRRLSSVFVQHKNIILVFIVHELFSSDSPVLSFVRKNTQYYFLFGAAQQANLQQLQRQLLLPRVLLKVYNYCRDELKSDYLCIDVRAAANRHLKCGLLSPEETPYLFLVDDV